MRKLTIGIKAKDLVEEMTLFKIQQKNLMDSSSIEKEHADNKKAVLNMLQERGILKKGSNSAPLE